MDAPDLGRRHDHGVGTLRGVKGLDGRLVLQVELAPGPQDERRPRLARQPDEKFLERDRAMFEGLQRGIVGGRTSAAPTMP